MELAALLILYFLPFIIAWIRGHRNAMSIFMVNLFLGLSVIGWIWAIIWAGSDNTKKNYAKKATQ